MFKITFLGFFLFMMSLRCQQMQGQQAPQAPKPFQCMRSPTVGSPINYIHKGLESIYEKIHLKEISAIPRMILDYTELGADLQHYAWFFPQNGPKSMLYMSMGNIRSQRASMENLFFTEVDESSDPNASYNQVLKVLKATKLDRASNQPMPFIFDKNSGNIAEYTVNCGNIKGSFIDLKDASLAQSMLLLKRGEDIEAVVKFYTFLQSTKAQKIFEEYGYSSPRNTKK